MPPAGETYVCDCACPCGIPVDVADAVCVDCQDGDHCPEMERFDPDLENDFRRENPREEEEL